VIYNFELCSFFGFSVFRHFLHAIHQSYNKTLKKKTRKNEIQEKHVRNLAKKTKAEMLTDNLWTNK